jgi:hypothetical protein
MIIDSKSQNLGLCPIVCKKLLDRTKFRSKEIEEVSYSGTTQDVICFKFSIDYANRRVITIHTTKKKIIKIRRDSLIDFILQ